MAKLTMKDLLRAHKAGGVLNGSYIGSSTPQNWDEWVAEYVDLTDPETAKFMDEWKIFNEASARFNAVLNEQFVRLGMSETD
jgi:hypothetical protein